MSNVHPSVVISRSSCYRPVCHGLFNKLEFTPQCIILYGTPAFHLTFPFTWRGGGGGWGYPQIPSIFGLPTPQDPRLATINEKCVNNHVNDHFQGKYSLTRSLGALRILDLPSQIASLYLYISIKCWVRSPLWAERRRRDAKREKFTSENITFLTIHLGLGLTMSNPP